MGEVYLEGIIMVVAEFVPLGAIATLGVHGKGPSMQNAEMQGKHGLSISIISFSFFQPWYYHLSHPKYRAWMPRC